MNNIAMYTLQVIAIIIIAPLVGGLLAGIDRKISAKMQSRKGPPLLQPFYDVFKLMQKKSTTVSFLTQYFVTFSLVFTIFTVVLFFMGADILLCVFAFTLACVFFVIAGYSSYSPYSFVGTERELIQIMSYEPMILIVAFGYYQVSGTFRIADALSFSAPLIFKLPLVFLGLFFVLTIKLRKSPFDLSMSHHGHQEIVKGITTELTGTSLAMVEIMHWYETIFALGLIAIFFVYSEPSSIYFALFMCLLIYFVEIIIDNTFARFKWKDALRISWLVTLVCGGINLLVLSII